MSETLRYGNLVLTIKQDDNAESPREWSNLGKMVCFHKRYTLGDKHDLSDKADELGWEGLKEYLEKEEGARVILPLYLYDHSGLTMRTVPFSCPWDSGMVGLIYVTKEMLKENGTPKMSSEDIVRILKGEVQTFDQFLTGDVYGYTLEEEIDCKVCGQSDRRPIDSAWGFYGSDHKTSGIADNIPDFDKFK